MDACEDLRKKLTEIKGLGPGAQYGLFLADEDPKRGVWLDSGRTLEHYLLRENVSKIEYEGKDFKKWENSPVGRVFSFFELSPSLCQVKVHIHANEIQTWG